MFTRKTAPKLKDCIDFQHDMVVIDTYNSNHDGYAISGKEYIFYSDILSLSAPLYEDKAWKDGEPYVSEMYNLRCSSSHDNLLFACSSVERGNYLIMVDISIVRKDSAGQINNEIQQFTQELWGRVSKYRKQKRGEP